MAGNDRILSSAEAFQEAENKFNNRKMELQNAYLTMTSAVFTLDSSWNGEASEAFKNQYNELQKKLKTSDGTIDAAIATFRAVAAGHEEMNQELETAFAALEDTSDPFANG